MAQHLVVAIEAAEQANSTLTGFPLWSTTPEGFSDELLASVSVLTLASTVGSAIYASYILHSRRIPWRTHPLFHLITLYTWSAAATAVFSKFVTGGPGKYLAPVAAFQNAFVGSVLLFGYLAEGKDKHTSAVWWGAALVYAVDVVLTQLLAFPKDAYVYGTVALFAASTLAITMPQFWVAQWESDRVNNVDYFSVVAGSFLQALAAFLVTVYPGNVKIYYVYLLFNAIGYFLFGYFVRSGTLLEAKLLADDPEATGVDSPLIGPAAPVAVVFPHINVLKAVWTVFGAVAVVIVAELL